MLEASGEIPLVRGVKCEEAKVTSNMAHRYRSGGGKEDKTTEEKLYPADVDPTGYEAEWPGYWDEDQDTEAAPRQLPSATLGHRDSRASW